MMELAQLDIAAMSATKLRAMDDAASMSSAIHAECLANDIEPPPYNLVELIGKGSFGRVYKATTIPRGPSTTTAPPSSNLPATTSKSTTTPSPFPANLKEKEKKLPQTVAIKIISIEENDALNPHSTDTFSDILREVSTLKLLDGCANINRVLDALLVGHTIWLVTEHCAGGSVSTLMRPFSSFRSSHTSGHPSKHPSDLSLGPDSHGHPPPGVVSNSYRSYRSSGYGPGPSSHTSLLPGGSGLPETYMIPILREVASAVSWIHAHNIIHRDLKCANVLVGSSGNVQVCDFGVAGWIGYGLGQRGKRTTFTGTLQWMAPELFEEGVEYGKEVDVWAFGSLVYEAATGLPPNADLGAQVGGIGERLRRGAPRLEGGRWSAGLRDLVSFCMVGDPKDRPTMEGVRRHGYIFGTEDRFPTKGLAKLVEGYRRWELEGGDRRSLFCAGGARARVDVEADVDGDGGPGEGWDYGTLTEGEMEVYEGALKDVDTIPRQQGRQRRRRLPRDLKVRIAKAPLEKVFDANTVSNYHEHARAFYNPAMTTTTHGDETIRESPVRGMMEREDQDTIKPSSRTNSADKVPMFNTSRTQDWTFPAMASASEPVRSNSPNVPCTSLIENGDALFISNSSPPKPRSLSARISTLSLIDLDASLLTPMREGCTVISPAGSLISPMNTAVANTFDAAFSSAAGYITPPNSAGVRDREPSLYLEGVPRIVLGSRTISDESVRSGGERRYMYPELPSPPAEDVILGRGGKEMLREEVRRMLGAMEDHLRFTGEVMGGMQVRREQADLQ
ncbi:hypothetical protein OQA88_10569 [Cercophora sp. LCS_1]